MIGFVNKYAKNEKFSQNGEEGILRECLRRLDILSGEAIEIVANDGAFCSNTALLAEEGWSCLFVEAEWPLYLKCFDRWSGYPNVRSQCSKVDGHNVNAFVKDDCDVLSIDTDGADFEIFKGLKAKPKIVIVEIDSSIPPDADAFSSDGGAGYKPMVELAYLKGYFLLAHTGNLVLIVNKYKHLFPEILDDPIWDAEKYFNRSWLKEATA